MELFTACGPRLAAYGCMPRLVVCIHGKEITGFTTTTQPLLLSRPDDPELRGYFPLAEGALPYLDPTTVVYFLFYHSCILALGKAVKNWANLDFSLFSPSFSSNPRALQHRMPARRRRGRRARRAGQG